MTIVFVHGGVSGVERREPPSLDAALQAARGARVALDAVEAAVAALEDHPALNAGVGSVLNLAGELELDAGIVDGASGRCGGVANVDVVHPIFLARRVLEETPHVLVAGRGADAFAGDAPRLPGPTPAQRERWATARRAGELTLDGFLAADRVDTVGAIALDDRGGLAAASSTGGVFGKLPGRVGDAPIFGAGIYASEGAAVVGTGVGELFLQTQACARAGRLIEERVDPQAACERVIALLARRGKLAAGLLAIDARGRDGAAFRGGSWAVEGPHGRRPAARLP